MPGTTPGRTSFVVRPHFIGCTFSQSLRKPVVRTSPISRRKAPEVLQSDGPRKRRGRRESRARAAPAVSCAKCTQKSAHEHTGSAEASGFPCAMVYGLFRALLGDRAFLPPSPLRSLLLTNLTPASGRQDHTASPSAQATLVSRGLRVHRISPRVRDDRDPSLSSGETARAGSADLPDGESEFLPVGLFCRTRCLHIVIASEAKQSIALQVETWIASSLRSSQ